MAGRTLAIGDVHGDLAQLETLLARFPPLDAADTIVFLGDYVDRGPDSAPVVELVRHGLATRTPARVVALRGNHEDAWLRVIAEGWPGFVEPPGNGCFAAMRSFEGRPPPVDGEEPTPQERELIHTGSFFPKDVVDWMKALPFWHEDDHAIYVHAGVPFENGRWPHPKDVSDPVTMLWIRTREFFEGYRGKRIVVGHTATAFLPPELSRHTPADPYDLWAGESVVAIDTGCGKGGFLTAFEMPSLAIYESR